MSTPADKLAEARAKAIAEQEARAKELVDRIRNTVGTPAALKAASKRKHEEVTPRYVAFRWPRYRKSVSSTLLAFAALAETALHLQLHLQA